MKPSNYNFVWPLADSRFLLFNSVNCALAETTSPFSNLLVSEKFDPGNLSPAAQQFVNEMTNCGFFIEDEIDEGKVLKYKFNHGKFEKRHLNLTIAPTLQCNFACPYCYEQSDDSEASQNHGFMTEAVRQSIFDFIVAQAASIKKLTIVWYGGEPLLAKDIIFALSEKIIDITRRHGVDYSAMMVSNGFLFEPETISQLKTCGIQTVQITLDGPPAEHNRRRKLKHGQQGTFERILENIVLLKTSGIAVHVRISIDHANAASVDELLDILTQHELQDIHLYPGRIVALTKGCASVQGSCLATEDFSRFKLDFWQKLHRRGFKLAMNRIFPKAVPFFCNAASVNTFVIDSDGDMYKCMEEIGDKERSIGSLAGAARTGNRQQKMQEIRWLTWEPFEFSACRECKLLPICQGGCPYQGMFVQDNVPHCPEWKYSLEQYEKLRYTLSTGQVPAAECRRECQPPGHDEQPPLAAQPAEIIRAIRKNPGQAGAWIEPDLIAPANFMYIQNLVQKLACFSLRDYLLECSLRAGEQRGDVSVGIDIHGNSALFGTWPASRLPDYLDADSTWQRLHRFVGGWRDPATLMHRFIKNIWLEFDVLGPVPSAPLPCLFLLITRTAADTFPPYGAVMREAFTLLDALPPATVLAKLDDCLEQFGQAVSGFCIGLMLPRQVPWLRLVFSGIAPAGWQDGLQALGRPVPAACMEYLSQLNLPAGPKLNFNIDVGETLGPKLGIDFFFPDEATAGLQRRGTLWKEFLNRLVADGLCSPARREAVLNWPGGSHLYGDDSARWLGADKIIARHINHIKIDFSEQSLPQAKVYLVARH